MYVVTMCLLIGIFAGWLTGRALKGNQYGLAMDVLMGIVGAAEAGLLVMNFTVHLPVIAIALLATVGAVAMTVVGAYLNGRKRYA